ncbi:type II secretion system inner membrane protein GspF [Parvularcula sp. LCG005]|uniref:type II secretion system inner membrane protein GspF n=1 Tax=Parvularcula sp. LCG005 TaxID=3078805 RepID=UPI002941D9D5|nr:type II secretion system inner membrane protein GspF [Parvularcula sp. LCG005]WOI54369.1 type II secretion system inner membrane protein GspF [Parvularcula sp. LCG005]
MTTFRYEAVDTAGRRRKGVINAETQRRARKEIQASGLTPVSLKSVRERTASGAKSGSKPSSASVIAATRQLATLIDASTTVEEALAAVGAQMKGTQMGEVLLSVRGRIIEGWRLSDALAEHPKAFSPLYRGIVAAGESSGNLAPVMLRLADMVEKNRAMLMKAITALIYPAVIFVIAVGTVAALMHFVVPQIVSQFTNTGTDLPLITRIVIASSDFMRAWGWLVGLMLIGLGAGVWLIRRTPDTRRRMDRMLLKLPLLGGLMRDLDAARFARTLSTLFASGTPLLDSLQAARNTVTNAYIHQQLDVMIVSVREGASLSAGVRRAGVFPPLMASMVAAGERSGTLPLLLEKTAFQMEQAFDATVTVALRLLEPAIIVILGGIVMTIILAIMLPILQLNQMAL